MPGPSIIVVVAFSPWTSFRGRAPPRRAGRRSCFPVLGLRTVIEWTGWSRIVDHSRSGDGCDCLRQRPPHHRRSGLDYSADSNAVYGTAPARKPRNRASRPPGRVSPWWRWKRLHRRAPRRGHRGADRTDV